MRHRVYIGAGSNLGDRQAYMERAASLMGDILEVLRTSPAYETAPWGYLDQGYFLNQVFEALTDLEPHDLLIGLKKIERSMGRNPRFRNGPRLIDLDILFYDRLIFKTPTLEIPHSHISERAFILVPLADLIPDFIHPVLQQSISDLLAKVDQSGVYAYKTE
jgi:2-amino-4-hydroxy-6-hydroxymethyldihydropteridine diphosphokinase